jgi:PAS domain S-box-containing protein
MVQDSSSKKGQPTKTGTSSPHMLKIADDSTERKETQGRADEIAAERQRLYSLFMQAPAMIAILRGPSHIYELANPLYLKIVGKSKDILGKTVNEVFPELNGQGILELLDNIYTTGEPFIGDELLIQLDVNNDGVAEDVYFNFVYQPSRNGSGNVDGILVHAVDVTSQVVARQKAEELALQVEQQAQTFDVTLTALKDFVYTFDISGKFTYSNKPLLELLAITYDEIIGKSFLDLPYPEELATKLLTQIQQVVATGKPVTDETVFTSPSGYTGYYEYIFMPVFDKNGRVVLVAGSTRDITNRKQLESQKDEFMGIVSHELKTPVTSIKAFTQVLQNRFAQAGDEQSSALLGKMDAQINKLTALIADLLDVTKIEGGKLQFNEDYFSFDELVAEIVEEIQRTTHKHAIEKIGFTNKTVFGDTYRIGQVIINMLTNAIKYSPDADRIIVKTMGDNQHVTLCVQDFGVGIPEERQQQIFERFYRVSGNDTIPGIGLGLYISAEIIRRQGGTIWVESEQGKGSTFCFSLPVQEQKINQPTNTSAGEEMQHE